MSDVLFRLLSLSFVARVTPLVILVVLLGFVGLPTASWAAPKVEPSVKTLSETLSITAPVPDLTVSEESSLSSVEPFSETLTLRQTPASASNKKTEKRKAGLFSQWGLNARKTTVAPPSSVNGSTPQASSGPVPLPVDAASKASAKPSTSKQSNKTKGLTGHSIAAVQQAPVPANTTVALPNEETFSTLGVFMAQRSEKPKLTMASYDSFSSASTNRWAGGISDTFSNSLPSGTLLQELRANWSPSPANRWQAISSLELFIQHYNPALPLAHRTGLAKAILELSEQQGIDYRLTASMLAVESGFKYHAISSTGAMGLGQLKEFTARWLRVTNPFDPVENLQGMTAYLRYLVGLFPEDLHKAIGSYYVGQGAMQRRGMTADAEAYVQKVQLAYSRLRTS